MVEITLNANEDKTLTLQPDEIYLIHNCKAVQNKSATIVNISNSDFTDTNTGFDLGLKDIFIENDGIDIYLVSKNTSSVVQVRGGE